MKDKANDLVEMAYWVTVDAAYSAVEIFRDSKAVRVTTLAAAGLVALGGAAAAANYFELPPFNGQ
jgi:hypothetical protein